MSGPAGAGTAGAWLIAFVIVLVVQRFFELGLSARHEARLRAMGAVEHARGHFPIFIFLHTLFPLALLNEVLRLGARPWSSWPLWLVLLLSAQVLRVSSMLALGERWHVRIWVVPGMALVTRGPYRVIRHPAYVGVTLELLAAPLLFGAWRTAIVVCTLNAVALFIRIRAEERALFGSGEATR